MTVAIAYHTPGAYAGVSVELIHATAGTLQFARGFRYPSHQYAFFQPKEATANKVPFYYPSIMNQVPFDATWARMTDAELDSLRTFMFSTLPLFDQFQLKLVMQGMSLQVRFARRYLKVTHVLPGINEVSLQFLRV